MIENSPIEQPKEEKRWDAKDILAATDAQAVMEAYHQALKNTYLNKSDLQLAVGERLTQLGNLDHGMQFTLLGEQTKNTQRLEQTANTMYEAADKFGNHVQEMEENTEKFRQVIAQMEGSTTSFESATSRLSNLPEELSRSAYVISEAVQRFENAASRMQ